MARRGGFFKFCAARDFVQNVPQLIAQLADFLIAIAWIFLERFIQNLL